MAPATVFPRTDPARHDEGDERELTFGFSTKVSLTPRILFVNIFALALLAGGFFYLDSYRSRVVDSRVAQAAREARLVAEAIGGVPSDLRDAQALRLARDTGARIRLFDAAGTQTADTQAMGLRNFAPVDPAAQSWRARSARFLDTVIDTVVGAARPPMYTERTGLAWPDVRIAHDRRGSMATVWRSPDRTPIITAAAGMRDGGVAMTTLDARDITQIVRLERYRLGLVLLVTVLLSVLLSLFLARTIVRPMRQLARAAVRVRLGRAREVVVPRLPERADEIGHLARALSDMSLALRARIDAIEAFAADVTHEIKNPLASLRSAVDGMATVKDAALQAQLLAIVQDDVHRLDRLITDIADASRLDAQLSRATFEPVDVAAMITGLIAGREARGVERDVRLRFDRASATNVVMGEGGRLERVFENLIDNAVSFSPDRGIIGLRTERAENEMLRVTVEDEGPGVAPEVRDKVFSRFQSLRPEGEEFGAHSGLGLAIAKTIVEAHQGTISVEAREDRLSGARFVVLLPLWRP